MTRPTLALIILAALAACALAWTAYPRAQEHLRQRRDLADYRAQAMARGVSTDIGRAQWAIINTLADHREQRSDGLLRVAFCTLAIPECDRPEVLRQASIFAASYCDEMRGQIPAGVRPGVEELISEALASEDPHTQANAVWAGHALGWTGLDKRLRRGSMAWNAWNELENGVPMPERTDPEADPGADAR